jgi:Fic family protein
MYLLGPSFIGTRIGKMFTEAREMEPLMPALDAVRLRALAFEAIRESVALGASLHPLARRSVASLLRKMNSYYSNLIEGHNTHPADIDRALAHDYSADPARRALQIESAAHVEVQGLMEDRLASEGSLDICHPDFLCWLHDQFYRRLPEELHWVERADGQRQRVTPGLIRSTGVRVGRHFAPLAGSLPSFLARFADAYAPGRFDDAERIVAAAAAHHRLLWIHPFLDGNGRVARLFTHAYLHRAKIDGSGLWAVTRGLARGRDAYLGALEGADEPRRGDLDGRGNLSDAGLAAFCSFFLETVLDQIRFMRGLLELDALQTRLAGFVELSVSRGELRGEAAFLLRDVVLRGEVARGDASRITGLGKRSAQALVAELLRRGLLASNSAKGPLHLGLPANVVAYYFPRLYPEAVEAMSVAPS